MTLFLSGFASAAIPLIGFMVFAVRFSKREKMRESTDDFAGSELASTSIHPGPYKMRII